ncbi:MAG: PilZ domain-containing protein [Candidatus Sulfotelmatobacter sp.]
MAQEINEGIAYLRAPKQWVSPLAPTADAPALEPGAEERSGSRSPVTDSGERFKGAEKRRSPRYKCAGSAELREDGCDVRTRATFSDISLHGCYVEAQATYPVGTVLHMKRKAHGVRLETKGSVRVSYPCLGMGLAFVDITAENHARLRELLATITRPTVIMGPGMASSLPACSPLDSVPLIADPGAALEALTEFFESRQMLMREDFLRILRKSQLPSTER